MSNFELDDRHRSLRDFLSATLNGFVTTADASAETPPLGSTWIVHTDFGAVRDEERPVALVEPTTPTGPGELPARASTPQGNVQRQQTFTITLYPEVGDTPAKAGHAAAKAATQLERAITHGLVSEDDEGEKTRWSAPLRLPVFDYTDVPVEGEDSAGPVEPYGWLWVEDAPVRRLRDAADPKRYTVVCDLRLSWEEMGRTTDPAEPIAAEMPGGFGPVTLP